MADGAIKPVIAGLAVGIAFIALFVILQIPQYPVFANFSYQQRHQGADYTPLLKLQIIGLRDSYKVGESVDFSVRQTAGGGCVYPEYIMIKDLDSGTIIREWNTTSEGGVPFCRVVTNPATFDMTWSSKSEGPTIINQTGSYAVVAKHLFKTVQEEFNVVALSDEESDTSKEVVAKLSSTAKDLHTVQALLDRYPDANSTITANYHSKLFHDFQKYDPHAIVQYSAVAKMDQQPTGDSSKEGERYLSVTIIFDRYYEYNTAPLTIVQCIGENYSSRSVSELSAGISEIEKC